MNDETEIGIDVDPGEKDHARNNMCHDWKEILS